jgi:hypothetical protein
MPFSALRSFGANGAPVKTIIAAVLSPHRLYNCVVNPSNIYNTGNSVFVAGSDGIYEFYENGTFKSFVAPTSPINDKFAVFNGNIVTVGNGGIVAFNALSGAPVTLNLTKGIPVTPPRAVAFFDNITELLIFNALVGKIEIFSLKADNSYEFIREIPTGIQNITDITYSGESLMVLGDGSGVNRAIFHLDFDSGSASTIYSGFGLNRIAASPDFGTVFIAYAAGIVAVNAATREYKTYAINPGDISTGRLLFAAALSAHNNMLFVSDPWSGTVQVFNFDTSFSRNLIAAGGSETGRLSNPSFAYISGDRLIVTERGNNRISVIEAGTSASSAHRPINPSLAATGADGRLYVVDNSGGRLNIFSSETSLATPISQITTFGNITNLNITGLAAGSNNTVYIADNNSGKIFAAAGNANFEPISDIPDVMYIAFLDGRNSIFATDEDGNLYEILPNNDGGYVKNPLNAPSITGVFDVDFEGKIFELRDNKIFRYELDGIEYKLAEEFFIVQPSAAQVIRELTSLSINRHHSALAGVEYGDIILTDAGANCVFTVEAKYLGVNLFCYDNYENPPQVASNTPFLDALQIRLTTRETPLYGFPTLTHGEIQIPAGGRIFVIEYAILINPIFSFVVYENCETGELTAGYVLNDNLSAPLPHTSFAFIFARILRDDTNAYKYPSSYDGDLQSIVYTFDKDDTITIVNFAYDYIDASGVKFVAVQTGDAVAYIKVIDIIHASYDPADSDNRPADATVFNAGADGAPLFIRNSDGSFSRITDEPPLLNILADDTRVKVVGTFDPNSDYTEIIFYDYFGDMPIQRTAFIETRFLDHDSSRIIQTIALLLIVVALLISVIAALTHLLIKRKKV